MFSIKVTRLVISTGDEPSKETTVFILLILCLETLFIEIRDNNNIRGIRIGGHEIKLFTYADDADLLTLDTESLKSIFQTCTEFQLYSSLKLNLEKSEKCWIGTNKGSNETPLNCK